MDSSSADSKCGLHHPPPTDFDAFLPWACSELSVEAEIVIVRGFLKQYVSTVVADRQTSKKAKRTKSRATSASSTSSTGPDDKTASVFAKSIMDIGIPVTIETYYDNNGSLVQLKFLNNKHIPREILKIIGLIIPYHKFLNSITINSGLAMDAIYELSKFLHISHITELNLDRTFLIEANYHILLEHRCLKYLSLAKCKINDTVVKTIASKIEFPNPASQKLSVLNLATNRISDTGAKYLADVLRANRQLSYLNLSDNMITDDGAISILNTLKKFQLTEQEFIDSRGRYLEYIKKKNGLINLLTKELLKGDQDKKAVKKKVVKPLTTMLLRKNKPLEKELSKELTPARKSFEKPFAELRERANSMADCKMGSFSDPFSAINIEEVGKTAYCYGNNGLCYLNLAYNDLTYVSLKVLYEVVMTQRNLNRVPKGLINVVIDGNFIPNACEELQQIDEILSSGLHSITKLSDTIKKKSSTIKSSGK